MVKIRHLAQGTYVDDLTFYRVSDTGYNGVTVINAVDWGSADVNISSIQTPTKELYCSSTLSGRTITLTFWVFATSYSQMQTRKNSCQNKIGVRKSINVYDADSNRHIDGYAIQSIQWGTEYKDNNAKMCKGTVQIKCLNPVFSDGYC